MRVFTPPHLHPTQCIDSARNILDTELTALVGESYNRAYGVMVSIQLLSELEETVQCLMMPERKPQLQETWWNRLLVCGEGGREGGREGGGGGGGGGREEEEGGVYMWGCVAGHVTVYSTCCRDASAMWRTGRGYCKYAPWC